MVEPLPPGASKVPAFAFRMMHCSTSVERPEPPALLLHTGDLTHLAKPSEFDICAQIVSRAKVGRRFPSSRA